MVTKTEFLRPGLFGGGGGEAEGSSSLGCVIWNPDQCIPGKFSQLPSPGLLCAGCDTAYELSMFLRSDR